MTAAAMIAQVRKSRRHRDLARLAVEPGPEQPQCVAKADTRGIGLRDAESANKCRSALPPIDSGERVGERVAALR